MVKPVLPDFSELSEDINRILRSGMVTKGEYLERFESIIADHLKVKHAVAVSSCTSGLMLTYRGLNLSGDVVVPSFTFMATISALVWSGLNPIFADVDPNTTNLDPEIAEAMITPNTSAIVAVHNFGNPASIDALIDVANRHGIYLIFDAAHGFGSVYQGEPVGGQGDAQVFSLSPTKLLITGEGGIVATNNDDLARKIRCGREYGNNGSYDSEFAGLNARMPEINALIGINSFQKLENAAITRNGTANIYHQALANLPGIGFQKVAPGNRNSYKDFSITIDPDLFGMSRDILAQALHAENIDTRKYYDPPVHLQSAYLQYYSGSPIQNTEWLASHSISLPIWSNMNPDISSGICEAIERIHKYSETIVRTSGH
ncbi:MAG: DegT/DnrJ/EryC1/StrS family aminotransferase [Anaerolineales bacterium]|nr:DegT/DnrJ/EryC1/StrS family aminotransferase [Anaerolineales bacterium]